ncbi:MAG: hypothetical protein RSD49_21015, partial [Hafnia sp.]
MKVVFAAGIIALAASLPVNAEFRYNYSLMPGNVPGNWNPIEAQFGSWKNVGSVYDCSNWSPSTSSQGKGLKFTQSATDCRQNQERWGQNYIKNNINGSIEKDGPEFTENRIVTASNKRDAIGILENWLPTTPTYTSWTDTNVLYGCTAWTPDPSAYSASTNFTQVSNGCKTDQERQRQDREKEKFTDEIRNIGTPVTERKTLGSQSASRPYSVVLGNWTDAGQSYACSNWSPAVETIGKGIAFTQTASNCKIDQTRTRTESYQDHRSGSNIPVARANENRVLSNQSG